MIGALPSVACLNKSVTNPDRGGPECREGFRGNSSDVLSGQEESMLALIRQLHEENPFDTLRLGPVVGAAAGAVLERIRCPNLKRYVPQIGEVRC